MAINKKLLHFATKSNFSTQLANSNIDSKSIVFIKDTGEIWTHDKLYSCASWGTNQTNYVPLIIGGTSYNLSKDGHTHSYLPLSGGTITGSISVAGSITNLSNSGGGIFWNPYAESVSDGSGVASISVATSGGSTVMSIKQMNDANDYINFLVNSNANGVRINGNTIYHAGNLNLNNYAPQSTISATLPATAGWYRIATSSVNIVRCSARFEIDWALSGYHGQVTINAGVMYGQDPTLNMIHYTHFGTSLTKARIVYHSTYSGNYAYLEVYNSVAAALAVNVQMLSSLGWSLVTPSTAGSIPTGYSNQEITFYDGIVTEGQLVSSIATGVAPLVVSSTTKVNNLNSDLLDGYHAATSATANTIVQRDGNGYIYGVYINSSRANETSAAASYIYDSGDGWLRKKTLANAQAELVTKTQVETVLTGTQTAHNHRILFGKYTSRATDANIASSSDRVNSTEYFQATSTMTTNKPAADAHILHFNWDNTGGYDSQLAVTTGNSPIVQVRGCSAGTWGSWINVWNASNSNLTTVPWAASTLTMNGALSGATTGSFSSTVTASAFVKSGSSSSYVLLGDGTHKLWSDFATATHTHGLINSNFTVTVANTTTNSGWSMLNSPYGGFLLKSIRTEASAPSWLLGNFASGIVFGGSDTKGVISVAYNSPAIRVAGGNGSTPVWYVDLIHSSNISSQSVNYATSSGNCDTVDNQHFSYTNTSDSPTYLWASNSSGTNFLANRANISVNYANYSTKLQVVDNRGTDVLPNSYSDRIVTTFFNDLTGIGTWASGITVAGWDAGYSRWQIFGYSSTGSNDNLYFRSQTAGGTNTWNTLRTILHSGNYTSYSPSLTGSGANGTWGINISGAAAKLYAGGSTSGTQMVFNWSGQGGQPTWLWGGTDGTNMYVYNPSNFNVASATYLRNAGTGMLNVPSTGQIRYDYNVVLSTAGLFPSSNNSNSILSINRHAGSYDSQLGFSSDGNIYYRSFNAAALDTTTVWRTILDSANYTTYTVSKTGTGASGTWGINISGNADSVDGQNFTYSNSSNSPTYLWATDSNGSSYLAARGSISVNYANSADTSATATKLSSSRTFALTGDVTGTITSDLTSGVSIATTIAANSVALGTDTTGNYAASVGVSGNGLTITGSAGEGTAFTVNSNATNANTGSTLVFRDASGNFSAGTITAALSGNASTATKVIATATGTNTTELVRGNMADSDYFRILVGGTASDAGYAEIATADGGTEPIYVRQYSGAFTSLVRTAALLDEDGNTSFPGTVTASRFACSVNNLMAMKDGYLAFQTYAGGITVGCTIESPININNSAALGTTPTTWNWRAGSSSSWANFNIGSLTTYGTISASSTITTASYVSSAQGYYKSGSSNDYVLLGGGSHKSISDFRLQSEKVLKMVFRGYFTWTGTNSTPSSSNVVYSDFCTSYVISRVSTGRYRITFTGLKTTSNIAADTTLQIFGAGRNINSNDGNPCYVAISNADSNYFDIIIADDNTTNDSPIFTLYINQML